MSSAPPRQRHELPIEHEITEVRELALRGDPRAAERAEELRRNVRSLEARAELIDALIGVDGDGPGVLERLDSAIAAAQSVAETAPQVLLDVALGLLILGRPVAAVNVVHRALDAGAADRVTPAQLLAFVDRLKGPEPQRRPEVEPVLRELYERFIQRPERTLTRPEDDGARRAPTRRRRFLQGILRLLDERGEAGRDDQTTLAIRAGALMGLDRLDEALDTAQRAVNQKPDDALARALLVDILARRKAFGSAVQELQRLPSERRESWRAALEQVHLLVQDGEAQQAVAVAEEVLGRGHGGVDLRVAHAEALLAADRIDEAATHIEVLAKSHEDRADVLILRAELEERLADYDAAIATLHKAIERSPADPAAHVVLARLLARAGRLSESLAEIERAIQLDPGRVDLLIWRARELLALGRAVEALESIQLVELGPSAEAAEVHADILSQLGRQEEALDWYLKAFDNAAAESSPRASYVTRIEQLCDQLLSIPRSAEALRAIEHVREAGAQLSLEGLALRSELLRLERRPLASLAQVDEVAAHGFDRVWVAGTKGQTLIDLSRCAEALPLIEDALKRDPGYAFGASVLITALAAIDRPEDALAELGRHFPEHDIPVGWEVWATMARAQVLMQLGRFNPATDLLERALDEQPNEADWLGPLAVAYSRRGGHETALEHLQRTLEITGSDASSWVEVEYADALAAVERHDEARQIWERVVAEPSVPSPEPPLPRVLLDRARCMLHLGETDRAVDAFGQGFAGTTDPLRESRVVYAAALWLAGRNDDAHRQVQQLFGDDLRDEFERAFRREADYLLGRVGGVDALRAELQAIQEA